MRKDQRQSHKDLGETEREQSVLRPIPLEANRLKKFLFPVKLQVSFCPQWKETQFTFYISTEHTKQDDLKKKTHTNSLWTSHLYSPKLFIQT